MENPLPMMALEGVPPKEILEEPEVTDPMVRAFCLL